LAGGEFNAKTTKFNAQTPRRKAAMVSAVGAASL